MLNRLFTVFAVFLLSITFASQVFAGPKLTMLINQSPWFDGFAKTLAMYEEETGASIELDVNPYPAMSEKIRNSIRAPEGIYDIVITSTEFMSTYSDSGEFRNINDIDTNLMKVFVVIKIQVIGIMKLNLMILIMENSLEYL